MQYQVAHDESVTDAILRGVADVEHCAPSDLPPLYDAVEPDALDALFEHGLPGESGTLLLTFTYSDSTVVVHGDGTLRVTRGTSATRGVATNLEA